MADLNERQNALLQCPVSSGEGFLNGHDPIDELAREYLNDLLKGDRMSASKRILNAVDGGAGVRDIYMHVFQPVLYEVGRLWQVNRISVAEEHFITAATQLVMSQLYPYIFSPEKKSRVFVACSVGGELHEVGMRMVADFFEMEGWDTYYMGANTPTETVVETVAEKRADVLGISATMSFHLQASKKLIAAVRDCERCSITRIMVGGYCFMANPELWRKAGADGFATDAADALLVAGRLLDDEGARA